MEPRFSVDQHAAWTKLTAQSQWWIVILVGDSFYVHPFKGWLAVLPSDTRKHTSGSLIFSMVIRRREVWLESVCSQLLMSRRHGWRGIISSQYLGGGGGWNTHQEVKEAKGGRKTEHPYMRGMFKAFMKTMDFLFCLRAIKMLLGYKQRLILLKLQPHFCQISLPLSPMFLLPPSKPCSVSLSPIKQLNTAPAPHNHSWSSSFCAEMEAEKVTLTWQVDCRLRHHQPGPVRAH